VAGGGGSSLVQALVLVELCGSGLTFRNQHWSQLVACLHLSTL